MDPPAAALWLVVPRSSALRLGSTIAERFHQPCSGGSILLDLQLLQPSCVLLSRPDTLWFQLAVRQVSVVDELGVPVKFIGVGETVDDLQPFDPEAFVDALFPEA